jgi:hypothetical protein
MIQPRAADDFVLLTIAGVFMAATRLQNLHLGDDRQRELMEVIARGLADWNPENGIRGFEDCKAMFERTFDALTGIQHEPRLCHGNGRAIRRGVRADQVSRCRDGF